MSEPRSVQPREHEFEEIESADAPVDMPTLDDLKSVRLTLTADLGEAAITVRGILDLKQGSVVPLNKLAGEMTDLYINGVPLARGEVVVIADTLHVRVAEILGVTPEEKELASYEE